MKPAFSKARILIVIATVLLLVLAFPSKLYAKDIPVVQPTSNLAAGHHRSAMFLVTETFGRAATHTPERPAPELLIIEEDIRVRAATALVGDSAIKKLTPNLRVPVRMIAITAPMIDA